MQRVAADISARLAQLAKNPPDLLTYLRQHAECVVQALRPVGFSYEMASGQTFQRTFAHNYEALRLRDTPAQELAFKRAVRQTAESGKSTLLEANTAPTEGLHGLKAEDAPGPENLPLYNQTPYQQAFVPILLNKKSVGVLHAWFEPSDGNGSHARVALLAHAASEIELYLRARRISDISQELSRINTYARFLEDVAGDQDLESVAWKLVNYAREAVGCDRVCLFVDSRYGLSASRTLPPSKRLSLQACSGLRRPHPRSEHAVILRGHASELLKLAVGTTSGSSTSPGSGRDAGGASGEDRTEDKTAAAAGRPTEPGSRPSTNSPGADGRPQMRIVFTNRDASRTASRPEEINRYFEVIPMNWSTALPLYDRDNRVCGTLLFEGQQSNERMAALFAQMRDLAVSGGRALSTALTWTRRRILRGARVAMRWRDALLGTSRRRLALKYGLPTLLVVGLLAFPFPRRVRGDATLRPVRMQTVAALTTGRLMDINAREGDRVTKGQVLCVVDSDDLKLQLRQVEQEEERAHTLAAMALRQERNETAMQIAQLEAEKAATTKARILRDIERTVIRAPFDGILTGPPDLTQRRGQVVRLGETVAEVVDPSEWEVKVSIREQDVPMLVARVEHLQSNEAGAGVPGELVLTADPNRIFAVTLSDPSAFAHRIDTSAGKYNFSAVVPLPGADGETAHLASGGELKAGFTGRVRFQCGRRPLAGILFGDFVRFMKLTFF